MEKMNIYSNDKSDLHDQMHRYFVSFRCTTSNGEGFGNIVLEINIKITDIKDTKGLNELFRRMQSEIERVTEGITGVIILNYQMIN